ncbi:hypothetical protein MCOR27_005196 [Pyricularia oryzae]|nr:hypothetical protein MCOR01_000751 [Pyricularia oryzae]KAI6279334.1 hypothetical protein MCOR27_005196 [Pyricularia oryzae]KAI6297852.1 hypothetical protein MCOR29_011141 [Pyricularia oryzae]KAI6360302.1 hypothetical protein MCOR32_009052 [Pyricularia oryzae]KAI6375175.1 hypothetical protein MCOR31_002346 [Pyricularia oryzae]
MSFQTNVLQDGQWVTQTVDLNAVLKASNSKAVDKAPRIPVAKAPRCGIFTRTVVESPVVRHVLPCRLRCADQADIAFVGDYFVEIREYRMEDGQLHDVIRRDDFDERIRKAAVIGNLPDSLGLPANKRAAEEDIDMLNSSSQSPQTDSRKELLAPQMLLVLLENCKCIFMVLRTNSYGSFEFVTSECSILPEASNSSFGHQLAVDPSSRYIALSSSDSTFTVCELESRQVLESRYRNQVDLNPIKNFHPRTYNGVLQMMEFLFPKKGNEGEVILLMFIVRGGHTRMVLYDWEAGEPLRGALSQEANGHRLSAQNQLPLFLIPLRVGTSFIAVYRDTFCIVKDAQLAPPEFSELIVESKPPSEYYTGNATPLWASWARPFRLSQYGSDCVYIAREDGCVEMLFVNDDVDVEASSVGRMRCSISTAFGVLFDDTPSDILVAAGDAGPGVVWKVKARAAPEYLMHLPNWAPALDMVNTHDSHTVHEVDSRGRSVSGTRTIGFQQSPDRLFATSGKAASGAVIEYRHGFQADIGVQLDCDPTTTKAWLLPATTTASGSGHYLILTTPDRSTLLHLSDDLSELSCPEEDAGFDLLSQTYVAHAISKRVILQVTETHLACVAAPPESYQWPSSQVEQNHPRGDEDLLQTPLSSVRVRLRDLFTHNTPGEDMVFTHAAALDEFVLLSATTNHSTHIHLCRIEPDLSPSVVRSFPVQGEVTCLASGTFRGVRHVFAGLWLDNVPSLARLSLDGLDAGRLEIVPIAPDPASSLPLPSFDSSSIPHTTIGGYVSISTAEIDEYSVLVLGTREGSVITFASRGEESVVCTEKFGLTPVTTSDFRFGDRRDMVTVCCDSKLWILTGFDSKRTKNFREKYRVWPVDTQELKPTEGPKSTPAPSTIPIVSATALDAQLARTPQHLPLMLTTGNQIVLAEVLLKPRQVPWTISLGVTPTTAIYSHVLNCLVVGVIDKASKTTLKFIDLETGEDIAYPVKQDDESSQYVAGLGVKGDTILSLSEWIYQKSKHKFAFILVGSRSAGIQVITATNMADSRTGGKRKIKYYTRFKRRATGPVHCIIGHQDGIIYCQGSTLKWEILDNIQKKLVVWKTFDLQSPAKALSVWDGGRAENEQDQPPGWNRDGARLATRSGKTGKGKQKAADGDLSEPEEEASKESDAQSLERRLASHVIVTTMHHSVIVLSHRDDRATEMTHSHSDPFERQGLHSIGQGNMEGSSIYLTTDMTRALTGLWVPWRQPGCNCEVLFEAELPSSVRKMVAARTRPGWAAAQRTAGYGIMKCDGMETLGISVDGRLQHFQIIGIEAWGVLRLVVNLAMGTPEICPFIWRYAEDWQEEPEPVYDGGFMLQIDGNIVQRVLDKRALEGLFRNEKHFKSLVQKLKDLDTAEAEDGGIWRMAGLLPPPDDAVMKHKEVFFELVYAIMEYYLSPII